jgi:hypothetical protein
MLQVNKPVQIFFPAEVTVVAMKALVVALVIYV